MKYRILIGLLAVCTAGSAYSEALQILRADTPVLQFRAPNLIDGNLNTRWFNDNRAVNSWFELTLPEPSRIEAIDLAILREADRPFHLFVDGAFVGEYILETQPDVRFQRFQLPAGTEGRVVRVESYAKDHFTVYEVQLIGAETQPALSSVYWRSQTLTLGASNAPGEWRSTHVACDPGDQVLSAAFNVAIPDAVQGSPDLWPQSRLLEYRPEELNGLSGWRFTLVNDSEYSVDATFRASCQNLQ